MSDMDSGVLIGSPNVCKIDVFKSCPTLYKVEHVLYQFCGDLKDVTCPSSRVPLFSKISPIFRRVMNMFDLFGLAMHAE